MDSNGNPAEPALEEQEDQRRRAKQRSCREQYSRGIVAHVVHCPACPGPTYARSND
ncbi:hypothetical protein B0H17DRAFT_1218518 [Mycena rosella]|uniref:Uncharacterized protein n=1 Tax=Mycena rosella TaxID=1033263 RepID=A0AAD7FM17_MYCRO|nr:hypothetical protein B0H17DRAFT_1218518 [Mycena rosella]